MTTEEKARFMKELPEALRFDPGKGEMGTVLVNLAMPLANEYFAHAAGIMECADELGWKVTLFMRDRQTIDDHLEAFRAWVKGGHRVGIALSGNNGNLSRQLVEEIGARPGSGKFGDPNLIAAQFSDEDIVKMIRHLARVIKDRLGVEAKSLHYLATPDSLVSILQQAGITSLNVICPQQHFFQADYFDGTDLWVPFALDVDAPSFKSPAQKPADEKTIVDCLWTTRDLLGTYYYHCSPHSTHPLDRLRGGEDGLEHEYPRFIYDTIAQNSRWNCFGYVQFMMEMWIDLKGDLAGYCEMFKDLMRRVARLKSSYRVVCLTTEEVRELYRVHRWTVPPVAEVWTEFPRIDEVNSGYAQPSAPGGDAPLFLVAASNGRWVFSKAGKVFEPIRRLGYGDYQAEPEATASVFPVEVDDFTQGIVSRNDREFQFVRKPPDRPRVELNRELWLQPGKARQVLIARHRTERRPHPRFGLAFWDTIPSRETLSSLANGQAATFMPVDLGIEWHVDRLETDVSEAIEVTRVKQGSYIIRNKLPARFVFEAVVLMIDAGLDLKGKRVKINGGEIMSSYDPKSGLLMFSGKIPAAGHDLRLTVG